MAYISKEQTAAKRAKIKEAFPAKDGWKISVVNERFTSLSIRIMEGPIEFQKHPKIEGNDFWRDTSKTVAITNEGVNHHTLRADDHNPLYPKSTFDVLKKIAEIAMEGNYDNSDIQSDYFDVGFYFNLAVGRWDKPYQKVTK